MRSARKKNPLKRRWRWIKRGLLLATGLVVAAAALPFLFTGSLVRFCLVRSPLRDMPLRFESARLSPFGRLTLYNVALDDTREQQGQRLITAGKVEVSFRWADLPFGRLQQVAVENLDLTLRPGNETPVTLLRLITGGTTPAPAPVPASSPSIAAPLPPQGSHGASSWVDQVLISGVVRFEGYGSSLAAYDITENAPIPVHLMATSSGSLANWNGALSLVVGDATDNHPRLSARLTAAGSADDATVKLESLAMEHATARFSTAVARNWTALPEWARQATNVQMEGLNIGGSATFAPDSTISLTAELRDLTLQATASGMPLAVDHFAVGMHVEGKLSDSPQDDLAFSHMRASWEGLSAGNWKLGKGIADLGVEGSELQCNQLQTTLAGAELDATGGIDLSTGVLARGARLSLSNVAAPDLMARLPENIRRAVPWTLNGAMTVRVILEESDTAHLTAFVKLLCPEKLLAIRSSRAGGVGRVVGAAQGQPWGALSNLELSGNVYYALQPGSLPEVSHGRLTADEFVVVAPQANGDPDAGVPFGKIKSDFTITPEKAQLDDFYADLPGNGRVSAEAVYTLAGATGGHATLNFNGVDAALGNPWLPAGWSLSGQIDTGMELALSTRTAEYKVSFGLAQLTTLKGPEGTLSITGAPTPSAELHGVLQRSEGNWDFDVAEITDVGALRIDSGMIKALRRVLAPSPGNALDQTLNQIAAGGIISFDEIALTGNVAPSGVFAGNFALEGFYAGAGPSTPLLLQNLSFKAAVTASSPPPWNLRDLHVSDGQLLAEKVTLGDNVLTGVAGTLSLTAGQLRGDHLAFGFADGTVKGDAAMTLPARLDALRLSFSGISQQVVTRLLYPDTFTAEGPASGTLSLDRGPAGLRGSMDVIPDQAGRLKIARATSTQYLLPLAHAAAQAQGASLPDNFDDLLIGQLADYPYQSGHMTLQETSNLLTLTLNYTPLSLQVGDPGYALPRTVDGQRVNTNPEFQLKDVTIPISGSLDSLLAQMQCVQQITVGASTAPAAAATRP